MAATKTTRSLKLTCPFCSAHDSNLTLNLNDLDRIECPDCSEEFTPKQALAKVAEQLAKWQRLVAWIEAAPVADE